MLLAKLLQGVQAWNHGGANRGTTDAASIGETERYADDDTFSPSNDRSNRTDERLR